jgi:ABC-type phosphate transport system permease subunit
MLPATTIPNKKERILRALMLACIMFALGAMVVGGTSYPSLASSSALVNPPTPLGTTSYLLFYDADEDSVDDQLVEWGLVLIVIGPVLDRLLRSLYRERKLGCIINLPLERPG